MTTIPILNGEPVVTDKMKADCHGAFNVEIEHTCSACSYDVVEPVECEVCNGEITYTESHLVPWPLVKEIYKKMALSLIKESPPEKQSNWIPCEKWSDLPTGTWLVKIKSTHNQYHVAEVTETTNKGRLVVVGNHFSWDVEGIIAYKAIEKYNAL